MYNKDIQKPTLFHIIILRKKTLDLKNRFLKKDP